MVKKKQNHKYLLSLYARVDDFLSNEDVAQEELPDSVVSFCIVVEKLLKIKLYNKNPFLIFDGSGIKNDNTLSIIALKKEKDIETSKIKNILDRFEIIFKGVFTPDEIQALRDIYGVRNCFVHGYKADDKIDFDAEDMVRKMGTVWSKTSDIAISLFGKENVKNRKPKKEYTKEELERVLEEEVKKMIQPQRGGMGIRTFTDALDTYPPATSYLYEDRCPRCKSASFSLDGSKDTWPSVYDPADLFYSRSFLEPRPNLYKCRSCNLELTEKQYEIAKKILTRAQLDGLQ